MAKYTITHACGHVATHQIFGTNSRGERDRKVSWLESNDCEECYKAEQLEKETEKSKELALPELTGSEKQISWALKIRNEKISEIDAMYEKGAKQLETATDDAKEKMLIVKASVDAKYAGLKSQNTAKFWIDNRFETMQKLLSMFK